MRTKRRCLILLVVLAVAPRAFGGPEETIPPEILKQYDKNILSGKRPAYAVITQADIFGLRKKPKFNADLVRLNFDPQKLSKVQTQIIKKWVRGGHNSILLMGMEIVRYSGIIGVKSSGIRGSGRKPLQIEKGTPVATDVGSLNVNGSVGSFGWCGIVVPSALDTVVIAKYNAQLAAVGRFTIGQTTVFFFPGRVPIGSDIDRFRLNWKHWMLGLKVPGVADTGIRGSVTSTLEEQQKYDSIVLSNGVNASGVVLDGTFTIKTSYANLSFEVGKIEKIVFEGAGANLDVLTLKVGDTFSGVVQNKTVSFQLITKTTTRLAKDKVKQIIFRAKRSARRPGAATPPAKR